MFKRKGGLCAVTCILLVCFLFIGFANNAVNQLRTNQARDDCAAFAKIMETANKSYPVRWLDNTGCQVRLGVIPSGEVWEKIEDWK